MAERCEEMRKNTGTILIVLFCLFMAFVSLPFDSEEANGPFDYARITDVDYRAVVTDEPGGNGKVVVTERLTFDIHAASSNNLFWELWRDLPEEYIDGVKVEYQVNYVKQIMPNGAEVEYEQSPYLYWEDWDYVSGSGGGPNKWYHSKGPYDEDRRLYECVFFYVDGWYRQTAVFEIEYEMINAALRYNDCSELYITPYSEDTIKYLNSFKGEILVPQELMPAQGNYFAHTYGTNSNEFPFTESDSVNPGYHTFSFALDKSQLKFRPYNEYIEFSLVSYGEDKHSFTRYASVNAYYNDDVFAELIEEQAKYEAQPASARTAKIAVLLALLAIAAVVVFVNLGADKRIRRKHIFYAPATQFEYYRGIPADIDPNFAAALVFCKQKRPKAKQDGYAAALLSLVHKGYVKLEKRQSFNDWTPENVNVFLDCTPRQPEEIAPENQLTPTEEQYFQLLLRHAGSAGVTSAGPNVRKVRLSDFQQAIAEDYEHTNSFVASNKSTITRIGVTQGYFQKADYRQPVKEMQEQALTLAIFGVLVAVVGNIVSYQTRLDLAFGAFFILGIALLASAAYRYWMSSRYVLLTQLGEDEYAKWRGLYNYLNSATLLSERTVIELPIWEKYFIYATAFGISDKVIAALKVRCPEAAASPVLNHSYYRSVHFRTHGRMFRSATRSASFSARTGGSFGGHGGYGGGGRGGGGGGGGH